MTFRGVDALQNNIAKIDEDSREDHMVTKSDKRLKGQQNNSQLSKSGKQSSGTTSKRKNVSSSQETLFSEFEAIDIGIKIIDLLELLHSNDIIHTNLCPENIFLLDCKLHQNDLKDKKLCF